MTSSHRVQSKGRNASRSRRLVPLNCVDKCLLSLDGIGETMRIWAILGLEGGVDPARLSQGIEFAQKAHPVMRTILRRRWLGTLREIQDDLGDGVLTVQDLTELQDADCERYICQWMNEPMDLTKGFPVRALLLKRNEAESWLAFAFHHSAADGLRVTLFIRHVIDNYNGTVPDDLILSEDIVLIKSQRIFLSSSPETTLMKCFKTSSALRCIFLIVMPFCTLPPLNQPHIYTDNNRNSE